VREAVAAELEDEPDFEVVGQAASLAEAREMMHRAEVVILDLNLPDGSGVDLLPELQAVNPEAAALLLSSTLDQSECARALERGAAAALDKMTHLGRVAPAIRHVLARERITPEDLG
jgi:DNA-binding NarL/FixJ family response regulator